MHPDPLFRRNFITKHLPKPPLKIVEIGALTSPTFQPDKFDIRFIDYASRDQLIRDNVGNPAIDPKRVLDVNYPVPNCDYSEHIFERFDLAIANHVIEHIPDTIRWLDEIRAILSDDGHVFLSVPDRRYTFDYLRRETSIVDVLRAYYERHTKPSASQLFEHYYYRRPLTAEDCWNGLANAKSAVPGMPIQDARRNAERAARHYTSTHCHVYTTSSFKRLIEEMRQLDLLGFEIAEIRDVDRGANEFHVLLRKRGPALQRYGK